jgi:cytochrome P450
MTMTALAIDSVPRRLDELPSPKGLPLVGNLHQIDPPTLHHVLERWHAELGSPYLLRLGPKRAFVCADPDALQTALRERPERYRRISTVEPVFAEIGANGVFSVEGERWRPQRQLVMKALAPNHLKAFFPTLQAITERLRARWQRAADMHQTVQMTHDLVRYTVDVTTALAFGEDPNTLECDGDVIQNQLAQVFPMVMARTNAPFPLWRYLKLPKDYRFERALKTIHAHVGALIERARWRMRSDPSPSPRNLLEAMLGARDERGSGVDDEVVRANVLTLLLGGEDTTANTLAWTMPFLAGSLHWQRRLYDEACALFGAARVCPRHDDCKRLDLFEAVATEATRMKPIVPLIFLEPTVDVQLCGVALPAGTPLFFLTRPPMLDARRFAAPGEFRPERWLGGHDPHEARAWVQFGAGPRVCPGRHLAAVELRLVLSMLARNFTLEMACDAASIREVMAFTMMPSEMPVRLRRRP